jgi:aspartate aminotransferase-like enzyme
MPRVVYNNPTTDNHVISLMPGPVEIADEVSQAFHLPPVSHRCEEFIGRFEAVRRRLRGLTGAANVALLTGSGTLANEVVASCLEGPGVVLVNGEFGARVARQAQRWELPVKILEWPWGAPWDLDELDRSLDGAQWVWGVHLETSTGLLNDIQSMISIANKHGVKVCLDCISSLGAVPIDLRKVWLATGVSGKALGSFAGIAIVFAAQAPDLKQKMVPTYLDLGHALRTEGPVFTFPSPLLLALEQAIGRQPDYAPLGKLVRQRLREMGTPPLVDNERAAPIVTTFVPPQPKFIERCRQLGYSIGGESHYLADRGLVQIANMGAVQAEQIERLFDQLT